MKTPEEVKQYKREFARQWRLNNPDKVKEHQLKRKEKDKLFYEENKESKIKYQKEYYQRNKEAVCKRSRKAHLQRNYNLNSEQYLDLVVAQKNCCAICGKPESRLLKTGDVKPLSVDHNHTTNEVRELLCNDCNSLLGFAKEDLYVLQNAIAYIKKHSS